MGGGLPLARDSSPDDARRARLLAALHQVGREHSDATVFFHAAIAERLGLNATDEKAIGLLERLGPLTAGQLAQHTGLATASVTSLIDRLERRGFVRRTRDPHDRRRIIVEPDEERLQRIAPLFESPMRSLGAILQRYSTDQLALLFDFLTRDLGRLRDEAARLDDAPVDPSAP
jgi:DNA-binding MarR family transcriptional regulator